MTSYIPSFSYWVLGIALAILLYSTLRLLYFPKQSNKSEQAAIFFIAVLVRLSVAFWLFQASLNRGGDGNWLGRDDSYYLEQAQSIIQSGSTWLQANTAIVQLNIYYQINALAVDLLDIHALAGLLIINALSGGILALIAFHLGREIGGLRVAIMTGMLIAVFPRIVFWSSMNYRDGYLAIFWTLTTLGLIHFGRRRKLALYLIVTGFIGVLVFRVHQGIVLGFGLLLYMIIISVQSRVNRQGRSTTRKSYYVIGFLVGVILLIVYQNYAAIYVDYFNQVENLLSAREANAAGGISALFAGVSIVDAPWVILPGMAIAFVWPFPPWFIRADNWLGQYLNVEIMFWYALIPFFIQGLLICRHRYRERSFPLIYMALLGLVMAGMVTYGTLVRMTVPFAPLILTVVAVGFTQWRRATRFVLPVFGTLFVVSIVYAMTKGIYPRSVILASTFAASIVSLGFLIGRGFRSSRRATVLPKHPR